MKMSMARGVVAIAGGVLMLCAMAASAADLKTIEDRLAIEQVWSRYAQALDSADPEAYSALFTKDAYLEVDGQPFKGQAKIRELIESIRKSLGFDKLQADSRGRKFGPIRHISSSFILDLHGDTASSESYWTEIISNGKDVQGADNAPSVLKMGRYEDEFVRTNGKWLFSKRIVNGDLSMERPTMVGDPFKR